MMVQLKDKIDKANLKERTKAIIKNTDYLKIAFLFVAVMFIGSKYAYAVGGDPSSWISNAKSQVMQGISAIAFCVVAYFTVHYLMKKQIIPMLVFLVIAGLCLVIVATPDTAKSIGQAIVNAIFK